MNANYINKSNENYIYYSIKKTKSSAFGDYRKRSSKIHN